MDWKSQDSYWLRVKGSKKYFKQTTTQTQQKVTVSHKRDYSIDIQETNSGLLHTTINTNTSFEI